MCTSEGGRIERKQDEKRERERERRVCWKSKRYNRTKEQVEERRKALSESVMAYSSQAEPSCSSIP